jgi:hypothetical protein
MVYKLDWQLKMNGQPIKGGSFLSIVSCELIAERFRIKLLDESAITASFEVYSNVNIGGKDYLLLEPDMTFSIASTDPTASAGSTASTGSTVPTGPTMSTDRTLTVVRLFDKTRVCAMDPDRFSSLRNAFSTFMEMGETSSIATLRLLLI